MSFVLLVVTVALALIPGQLGSNTRPCQDNSDDNAYDEFVRKHVLQETFNTQSEAAWKRYLQKNRLCDSPRQSFIRRSDQNEVVMICNGKGLRVSDRGNLCFSGSRILVYDVAVSSDGRCNIERVEQSTRHVIVACDKVLNMCLPVDFDRYTGQTPDMQARRCKP